MARVRYRFDDGGRSASGHREYSGDCVCRAIAIACEIPYQEAFDLLKDAATFERPRKGDRRSSPKTGVKRRTIHRVMRGLGWEWAATMGIGTGCRVHVRADELPSGRLILNLSKHVAAFVDGELRDTYDCSRGGTRCVYGYWFKSSDGACV